MNVVAVPQLADNYAYLIMADDGACAVVDPADAPSILRRCDALGLAPSQIWATHHHADHTAGIGALLEALPACLLHIHPIDWQALAKRSVDLLKIAEGRLVLAADGHRFALGDLEVEALFNPGHTLGAVSYYVAAHHALFTGDTLFGAGCGRRFEGSAAVFHQSLMRLAALPDDTEVYFGHEYTASNLRFAAAAEPDNSAVQDRAASVTQMRADNHFTTPSTIALERATNPFLRCAAPSVQRAVARHADAELADATAVFAALRTWKDAF